MQIKEKMTSMAALFTEASVASPQLTAELVAAHCLHVKRLELAVCFSQTIDLKTETLMDTMTARIVSGEPLQYVLGNADFMGRLFAVDQRVLIPRPETEEMVALISDHIMNLPTENIPRCGIDVGTGSGCIVITLACLFPAWEWRAVDTSALALEVAQANAKKHLVNNDIAFSNNNLLDGVTSYSFDLVVANLPYIPSNDCRALSSIVRDYEPLSALDGGPNGLLLIDRLIEQAISCLRPSGRIFLEIGYDQGQDVCNLFNKAGFHEVQLHQDMAGLDRIVTAKKGNK